MVARYSGYLCNKHNAASIVFPTNLLNNTLTNTYMKELCPQNTVSSGKMQIYLLKCHEIFTCLREKLQVWKNNSVLSYRKMLYNTHSCLFMRENCCTFLFRTYI